MTNPPPVDLHPFMPASTPGSSRALASRGLAAPPGHSSSFNDSRMVDVTAVLDTTGSMSGKIQALVETLAEVVASLGRMQLDWRFSTVAFGDLTVAGDRIVDDLPAADTVQQAQRQLRSVPRFSGGGNVGESSAEAMLAACRRPHRPNAVQVIVLLTDEPALGSAQALGQVDRALEQLDAVCFVMSPDHDYFRRWATEHAGRWERISASLDTRALMKLFEELMAQAARVVDRVHTDHGGSVRRYMTRASTPAPENRGAVPAAGKSEPTARRITRAARGPNRPLPPAKAGERAGRELQRAEPDRPALPTPGRRSLGPGTP